MFFPSAERLCSSLRPWGPGGTGVRTAWPLSSASGRGPHSGAHWCHKQPQVFSGPFPTPTPQTGYMFGKGIYFADMVSKSANYCRTSQADPVGLILLGEVALGNM